MSDLALFLLRPPRVERDGEEVQIPRRKALALLAHLAVSGQRHRRDALATLLWPEEDQRTTRAYLRRALMTLRDALGGDWLDADRETVALNPDSSIWLDVDAFRAHLRGCRAHGHPADETCPACLLLLAEAAALHRDDFLEGFTLHDERASALERLVDGHAARCEFEPAVVHARRWLALDPLHEPAHRALMGLYARSGQRAAALRQYAECERVLREELGDSPGQETTQLYQAILHRRELPATIDRASAPAIVRADLRGEGPLSERYRLGAEIGRGGMGVVYRGHDRLLERDVAIKVLPSAALGAEGRARILREAQAAAQLNHPNVVSVHDIGAADRAEGRLFIVMELVEGASLRDRRPETLDQVLSIARQVCATLEHAHGHGIVHRDLKPGNVLLAADGTAKLADFGLARTPTSQLTAEGEILGTVFYLALEQALGLLLYELTAGQLRFGGEDPLTVISQHLHASVVPPSAHNAEIPPALDDLIVRLLSKRPEDRPASAAEVGRALDELLVPRVPAEELDARAHNLPA